MPATKMPQASASEVAVPRSSPETVAMASATKKGVRKRTVSSPSRKTATKAKDTKPRAVPRAAIASTCVPPHYAVPFLS